MLLTAGCWLPRLPIMQASKGALLLLLKGQRLNSDHPVPHDKAIRALLTLPAPNVVLLSVAYATMAAEQRLCGLPVHDAQVRRKQRRPRTPPSMGGELALRWVAALPSLELTSWRRCLLSPTYWYSPGG
eukprot:SAG22_NODE_1203_length_5178_cov_1.734200_5_plen_129_part_00